MLDYQVDEFSKLVHRGARNPYNFNRDKWSEVTGLDCDSENEPSLTQQSFAEDCDINEIVRRFGLTGEMPSDFRSPVSGDFTGITDFHSAMNAVMNAQEAFMELPAEMRARFSNDPQQLLAFVGDEKNRDEAIKLGLVPPPPEVPRDAVMAIDELSAKLVPKA